MKESKKRCLELIKEYKNQCKEMALEKDLEKRGYCYGDCKNTLGCLNRWLSNYLDLHKGYAFGHDLEMEDLIDYNFDQSSRAILAIIILEWKILERELKFWREKQA